MIFDTQSMLSNAQAVTVTAPSTNTLDLGPVASGIARDIGKGKAVPFRLQVVEDFNNLTSLTLDLQSDDNTAFSSPKSLWSQTVPLAELKTGKVLLPEYLPRGTAERYLRLNYTVTGTAPTAGRITAGVTLGNHSNG